MKTVCCMVLCLIVLLLCSGCSDEMDSDNLSHEVFDLVRSEGLREMAEGYRFMLKDNADQDLIDQKVKEGVFREVARTAGIAYECDTLEEVVRHVDGDTILWIETIVAVTW